MRLSSIHLVDCWEHSNNSSGYFKSLGIWSVAMVGECKVFLNGKLELYWNMSVVIFGHTDQFHLIDTVANACQSKLISTYASFYVYWSNPIISLWSFELKILKISSGEMLVDPWRNSIKNIKFVKLWRRNRQPAYTLQWRRRGSVRQLFV
jgi:hypothetical protein